MRQLIKSRRESMTRVTANMPAIVAQVSPAAVRAAAATVRVDMAGKR
jgi:hypothetical protein